MENKIFNFLNQNFTNEKENQENNNVNNNQKNNNTNNNQENNNKVNNNNQPNNNNCYNNNNNANNNLFTSNNANNNQENNNDNVNSDYEDYYNNNNNNNSKLYYANEKDYIDNQYEYDSNKYDDILVAIKKEQKIACFPCKNFKRRYTVLHNLAFIDQVSAKLHNQHNYEFVAQVDSINSFHVERLRDYSYSLNIEKYLILDNNQIPFDFDIERKTKDFLYKIKMYSKVGLIKRVKRQEFLMMEQRKLLVLMIKKYYKTILSSIPRNIIVYILNCLDLFETKCILDFSFWNNDIRFLVQNNCAYI